VLNTSLHRFLRFSALFLKFKIITYSTNKHVFLKSTRVNTNVLFFGNELLKTTLSDEKIFTVKETLLVLYFFERQDGAHFHG